MTIHSNLVFKLGDVIKLKGASLGELAIIVGGSFMGPPSFLGVLHVFSNNEVFTIDPESIDRIRFSSAGREVEFL
jgi:hypothetical protein